VRCVIFTPPPPLLPLRPIRWQKRNFDLAVACECDIGAEVSKFVVCYIWHWQWGDVGGGTALSQLPDATNLAVWRIYVNSLTYSLKFTISNYPLIGPGSYLEDSKEPPEFKGQAAN